MDEVKIKSDFAKMCIENIIRKTIKKKFGIDVDVYLKDVYISMEDGKRVSLDLGVSVGCDQKDIRDLIVRKTRIFADD